MLPEASRCSWRAPGVLPVPPECSRSAPGCSQMLPECFGVFPECSQSSPGLLSEPSMLPECSQMLPECSRDLSRISAGSEPDLSRISAGSQPDLSPILADSQPDPSRISAGSQPDPSRIVRLKRGQIQASGAENGSGRRISTRSPWKQGQKLENIGNHTGKCKVFVVPAASFEVGSGSLSAQTESNSGVCG